MSAINAVENEILNDYLGASATKIGSTLQIALSTTKPNDSGTGVTEPSGGSYVRKVVNNNGTEWPAASNGIKKNANDITFVTATGNWGIITHWAIYDGISIKFWGKIDDGSGNPSPKTVNSGDTFKFVANGLRITLD